MISAESTMCPNLGKLHNANSGNKHTQPPLSLYAVVNLPRHLRTCSLSKRRRLLKDEFGRDESLSHRLIPYPEPLPDPLKNRPLTNMTDGIPTDAEAVCF